MTLTTSMAPNRMVSFCSTIVISRLTSWIRCLTSMMSCLLASRSRAMRHCSLARISAWASGMPAPIRRLTKSWVSNVKMFASASMRRRLATDGVFCKPGFRPACRQKMIGSKSRITIKTMKCNAKGRTNLCRGPYRSGRQRAMPLSEAA